MWNIAKFSRPWYLSDYLLIGTLQCGFNICHVAVLKYRKQMCLVKQLIKSLACRFPHDDVFKWKHFQCYWPFVRGIQRSPVGGFPLTKVSDAELLICSGTNGWANNRDADELRRHRARSYIQYLAYKLICLHCSDIIEVSSWSSFEVVCSSVVTFNTSPKDRWCHCLWFRYSLYFQGRAAIGYQTCDNSCQYTTDSVCRWLSIRKETTVFQSYAPCRQLNLKTLTVTIC